MIYHSDFIFSRVARPSSKSLLPRGLRVNAKNDQQLLSGVAYPFRFLIKGWGGLRLNFPVLLPRLWIAGG